MSDPFGKGRSSSGGASEQRPTGGPLVSKRAQSFREAHAASDTDNDRSAVHHTLGDGPNQSAAGNHKHSNYVEKFAKSGILAVAGNFSGAAPPSATAGSPFNVAKAGTYVFETQISGFAGVAGPYSMFVYIDGVLQGSVPFFFNIANTHMLMPLLRFKISLTQGTHYIWCQFNGSSDSNDTFTVEWTYDD